MSYRGKGAGAIGKIPVMDLKDHFCALLRAAGGVQPTTIPAMELKNNGLSLHSLLIVERCSMSMLHARYSKKMTHY
jgi:hypothetical protein